MIKEVRKSKKAVNNPVGSLVYRIKNIRNNVGIKNAKFVHADMHNYRFYCPCTKIIGVPIPNEPDPRRWYYSLPIGDYAGLVESTNTTIAPRYVKIHVTSKGAKVTELQ